MLNERHVSVMSSNDSHQDLNMETLEDVLTPEDIKTVAQKFTNDVFVRVLNYEILDYTSYKLGFFAAHNILKIILQKSTDTSPQTVNFFLKSMPYTDKEQTDFLKEENVLLRESNFYKTLLTKVFTEFKHEKFYPTCYLAEENAIVMEDLRNTGYKTLHGICDDFVKLKSAFASLARFHSLSFLAEARIPQNYECSATLGKLYECFLQEKLYEKEGMLSYYVSASRDLTCALAESLKYDTSKIDIAYEKIYDMIQPSKTHRNVICHGGLYLANFMFDDSLPLPKSILIDYQTLRYAPLVTDLLQLLHLNCTSEFRHKNEKILVEFYYSVLQETIRRNDPNKIVKIPKLEELFVGIDDYRVYGLVEATVHLPTILMDSNVIGQLLEDSYKLYIYGDRLRLTLAHMKGNSFYKNLIESAVKELVEKIDTIYD